MGACDLASPISSYEEWKQLRRRRTRSGVTLQVPRRFQADAQGGYVRKAPDGRFYAVNPDQKSGIRYFDGRL